MGNSKSKQRLHAGHERLNENDKRYFAKVQARNSTTTSSRRFRKPHPVIAMKSCMTALTSIDPPRDDDDDESLATKSNSPSSAENKPFVGPLPPKMNAGDSVSTSSSFSRVKPTLSSISEREPSPTTVVLPSPKGQFTLNNENQRRRPVAQRRLEKARANQMLRSADSFPTDLSITSSHSSKSSHVVQDYYTEMMEEAHRESRQAVAEGTRDLSRTFDSLLPSSMVWAEVVRGGRVTCVAFSRTKEASTDNKEKSPLLMAVGTDDGTVAVVEIMDVPSSPLHKQIEFGTNQSKKIGTLKELPREGTIRSVDFSPDGRWLMVAGDDCMACLMRINLQSFPGLGLGLSSVEMVQEFEREDRVYCVQFSNDGKRVAMGGYDGIIAIASMDLAEEEAQEWPPTFGGSRLTLVDEILRPGLMLCLDWSPDGNTLAVGGSHKSCMFIKASSGKVVGEVQRSASVETVKWKPDGKCVAIGSSDGIVAIANAETKTIVGEIVRGTPKLTHSDNATRRTVMSGSCSINSLCWSPDGHFLAIAGSDNCCAIVETGSFALLHEVRRSDNVTSVDWKTRRMLTGEEGRYLAIGSEDRTVAIMKTGVVDEAEETADSIAESEDSAASSYFSLGSGSLSQHEWVLREDSFRDIEEVDSFSHTTACFSPLDHSRANAVVGAVAFSRHRKGTPSLYMATAYSNGSVTIVDTKDWRIMKQLTFSTTIKAIHFTRKSEFMALGADDGTVTIVSSTDWSIEKEFKVASSITALRFSRRNERLAIGSSDGIVTLVAPGDSWNIAGEIETSDVAISCIDWSSRCLAIGRIDGTISVHEATRVYENFFLPEAELTRNEGPVTSIAFGVGGQFLAVGDASGKIGIYSGKGGWVLCHQLNTPSAVLATKWSSDGQYLAFGGEQKEMGARVVDTVAWTNVKDMHKLDDAERFSTLDFSNNDKWIVLACTNGSLHVIDTIDWRVRKTFPGLSIPRGQGTPDSASSIRSKETESRTSTYNNRNNMDTSFAELQLVSRFLVVSRTFLAAHQEDNPPLALRPLLKCVLMLTIHVKWVCTKDKDVVQRISRVDDGEPAAALLWILGLCTDVMKQAMQTNGDDCSFSTSFGLGPRDLRRLQAWNDQWLLVYPDASCIDIPLLQDADSVA